MPNKTHFRIEPLRRQSVPLQRRQPARIRGIIDNAAAQIQSAQSITQVQALIESALAL